MDHAWLASPEALSFGVTIVLVISCVAIGAWALVMARRPGASRRAVYARVVASVLLGLATPSGGAILAVLRLPELALVHDAGTRATLLARSIATAMNLFAMSWVVWIPVVVLVAMTARQLRASASDRPPTRAT